MSRIFAILVFLAMILWPGGNALGNYSVTQTTQTCLAIHDFDTVDASDGDIDLDDYARFFDCSRGPFVTPDQVCGIPQRAGAPPPSGTFGMHGRAFDVLSDGGVLQEFRARTYFPQLGRWLQRDPTGYADGVGLYEAFRGNSITHVDPLGTEVWAEARRVKTTLNGVPVWRVDYVLNRDGVSLGIGGIFWRSAVEAEHAGTEYFRFTEDLRELRRIDRVVENQRQIVQDLGVANIQIASLEQGIRTSATIAVALPVAAVAAPAATAAFSTTTAVGVTTTTLGGNIAATALTGGVSLGVGAATGEALIGGTAGEIAVAGGGGFLIGTLVSAPFGALAPAGVSSVAVTESSAFGSAGARLGVSESSVARGVLPNRLARVIDLRFARSSTLGAPGARDVFVTAAEDIAGITSAEALAGRLTLVTETGQLRAGPFLVIEFENPIIGLASPINRVTPGFIGRGVTQGGAREFVIQNVRVEELLNVTRRVVP